MPDMLASQLQLITICQEMCHPNRVQRPWRKLRIMSVTEEQSARGQAAMRHQRSTNDQTFAGVFLIGLALLFITGFWWPGILYVIGIAMLVRTINEGGDWRNDRNALVVLGIGIVFTVLEVFDNFNLDTGTVWPIILIAVGAYLLWGKNLRGGSGSGGSKTKNDDLL